MELGIEGKKALVTGASAGLGFAVAMALAQEKAVVAINSRSAENLKKAADKIKAGTGLAPAAIEGDLSVPGAAEKIAREAVARIGDIDILVSNAGGPPAGLFTQLSEQAWKDSTLLTLHSAINLTREVIPAMIKKKWGRIIFMTSIAVKQPIENLIISNTLRAGLTGFAKSISNELGASGITVNTVCPGYTDTDRLKQLANVKAEATGHKIEDIYAEWTSQIPVGRVGRPEEPAALIAFLASEKAAYLTGASIPVDGGHYKGLL
jgi:3-oxoacyl-[acyl-carrier protein] reductase